MNSRHTLMAPGCSSLGGTPSSDGPIVHRLDKLIRPEDAFQRLASLSHRAWLDSALQSDTRGRYSYLTADPVDLVRIGEPSQGALGDLRQFSWLDRCPTIGELPPFQGGVIGTLSYDLARGLESLPPHAYSDLPTDCLFLAFYDWCLAFDHQQQSAWLIAQGWDPTGKRSTLRARQRMEQIRRLLDHPQPAFDVRGTTDYRVVSGQANSDIPRMPQDTAGAPQYATAWDGITSNFSAEQYRNAVREIVSGIFRGDTFQVNLAQRLLAPQWQPADQLYLALRASNPAPYAGFFDAGNWQLLCSSPEQFLSVRERRVRTCPIKGTMARHQDPLIDQQRMEVLRQSEKDIAENVMIVDLLRNDLSRVCDDDSVTVTRLCSIESFAHVHHLVSEVQGDLRTECDLVDLLEATFPGGSITGAPKVQAMRTIACLEPTARGLYCGSMGFLAPGGISEWNILIRSIVASRGWLQTSVGGGITARSDPQRELEETWAKARGLVDVLQRPASQR